MKIGLFSCCRNRPQSDLSTQPQATVLPSKSNKTSSFALKLLLVFTLLTAAFLGHAFNILKPATPLNQPVADSGIPMTVQMTVNGKEIALHDLPKPCLDLDTKDGFFSPFHTLLAAAKSECTNKKPDDVVQVRVLQDKKDSPFSSLSSHKRRDVLHIRKDSLPNVFSNYHRDDSFSIRCENAINHSCS